MQNNDTLVPIGAILESNCKVDEQSEPPKNNGKGHLSATVLQHTSNITCVSVRLGKWSQSEQCPYVHECTCQTDLLVRPG